MLSQMEVMEKAFAEEVEGGGGGGGWERFGSGEGESSGRHSGVDQNLLCDDLISNRRDFPFPMPPQVPQFASFVLPLNTDQTILLMRDSDHACNSKGALVYLGWITADSLAVIRAFLSSPFVRGCDVGEFVSVTRQSVIWGILLERYPNLPIDRVTPKVNRGSDEGSIVAFLSGVCEQTQLEGGVAVDDVALYCYCVLFALTIALGTIDSILGVSVRREGGREKEREERERERERDK